MTKTVPIDVTDQLRAAGHLVGEDHNDEDRVFRSTGKLVKVKVRHDEDASGHGREVYRVTGSMVGKNGKARRREGGSPAVHDIGRHVVVQGLDNLVVTLERARFDCVAETLQADANYRARTSITGVGTVRGS